MNPFSLDGRTALVTGSARGLGLEMARGLAQAGARVLLNGRDPDVLEQAVAGLRGHGLAAEAVAFDVTDHDAASRALAGAGPFDVLINTGSSTCPRCWPGWAGRAISRTRWRRPGWRA
jgi:gluconate 5-dehydrogenase